MKKELFCLECGKLIWSTYFVACECKNPDYAFIVDKKSDSSNNAENDNGISIENRLKKELNSEEREYISQYLKANLGYPESYSAHYNDGKYRITSVGSHRIKKDRYVFYFALTHDNEVVVATYKKPLTDYDFGTYNYCEGYIEYYIIPLSIRVKIKEFFKRQRLKYCKHFKKVSIDKVLDDIRNSIEEALSDKLPVKGISITKEVYDSIKKVSWALGQQDDFHYLYGLPITINNEKESYSILISYINMEDLI